MLLRPDETNTMALRPDVVKIVASGQIRPQDRNQKVEAKASVKRPKPNFGLKTKRKYRPCYLSVVYCIGS